MRPVERANVPLDKNGNPKQYKEYGEARDDLIACLGEYCSYCEVALFTPAIEHIEPKSLYSALEKEWDNFLLACTYCNSNKGDADVNKFNMNNYFWADKDNTFLAFYYEKDRAPQVELSLNKSQKQIAQNTLELTGLDRERGHPKLSQKDRRCKKRNEVWALAEEAKSDLTKQPTDITRKHIVTIALGKGFFSVWMSVFIDDTDMRQRLISAFKGTSQCCFDQNAKPIPRPNGQI